MAGSCTARLGGVEQVNNNSFSDLSAIERLAPRAGVEPATGWLIPPVAGLSQLSNLFEESSDACLLDVFLLCHGL